MNQQKNNTEPPIMTTSDNEVFYLQSKTGSANGVNRMYDYEGEDIGIRKIRVIDIVDVKYELK